MPPKLPPLAPLQHLKPRADLAPQIYFCGQIVGGIDFNCPNEGLLCQMSLETGQYWELIQPNKAKIYQTQTAYAEKGEMVVWAHPFEFHFKINELSGWPKAIIRVWRFNDSSSTNDLLSYGVIHLPKTPGFTQLQCDTWTPFGDWKYSSLAYYMDTPPRLASNAPIGVDVEKRKRLFTQASGKVIIEVDSIRRNFGVLHISQ